MPLYDYECLDCGKLSEILIANAGDQPQCQSCGSKNLKKMISAPSSLTGASANGFPGPGDTTCCGSNPATAGCAGPGSCCGKSLP
ncbi:MAG: zinc ribbon domain-containing protein [Deltaproteobacteria bacterium]|nr:zinc ribbon domain-containing protein [Deltaproteobacteria bacterium]